MRASTTTRPSSMSRPAAAASLLSGRTPIADDDELSLHRGTGVEGDAAVLDSGHARGPDQANADVGQHLRYPLADLDTEPPLYGHRFGRHERGRRPAGCEAGGRLASDQPAPDHDGRFGVLGGHPQDDGVGERPQGQRRLPAGHGERHRVAPQANTRCQ